MTVGGLINVNIVTSILNAMHKDTAKELRIFCWNYDMHCFNLYRRLNCIKMIGAGILSLYSLL